jgi:hypothetical protein
VPPALLAPPAPVAPVAPVEPPAPVEPLALVDAALLLAPLLLELEAPPAVHLPATQTPPAQGVPSALSSRRQDSVAELQTPTLHSSAEAHSMGPQMPSKPPCFFALVQALQAVVQASLQQTPSVQMPLWQSAGAAQGVPSERSTK